MTFSNSQTKLLSSAVNQSPCRYKQVSIGSFISLRTYQLVFPLSKRTTFSKSNFSAKFEFKVRAA